MEKSLEKGKSRIKGKALPKTTIISPQAPTISKATTKNKDKALRDVLGMWADREETNDVKTFRGKLWRKTS